MRTVNLRLLPCLLALLVSCQRQATDPVGPDQATNPAEKAATVASEHPGLHNVFPIGDKVISGSSPEGRAGFQSLHAMGIRTIISVDGAKPQVDLAREQGLRYVHIPIGYDGLPRESLLHLVRASQELPGPVYIHCHHGKHRGPTAAVAVQMCLDDSYSRDRAHADLQRAGTDPHYQGLFASIEAFKRPTAEELCSAPADFPEIAVVPDLVALMVQLDEYWEQLGQVRAAGWKPPANAPDLDPHHVTLMILEQYREMNRLPKVQEREPAYRELSQRAESEMAQFEGIMRDARSAATITPEKAEQWFQLVKRTCRDCHIRYRDQ